MSDVQKVAPRNSFKKQPVFVKATTVSEGEEPGYKYQWVEERDINHPQHVSKYMRRQRIGSADVGFAEVEGWEVVHIKPEELKGRPRDDQGKPVDTVMRHGSLVKIRTSADNFAVYEEFERLKDELRAKRLRQGDFEALAGDNGGSATYRARVANNFTGNHRELLNQPQGE
tara:strand:+ start:607 stop:1119 length:513 start_codon:yes stop_codon:yes gene_type:complete